MSLDLHRFERRFGRSPIVWGEWLRGLAVVSMWLILAHGVSACDVLALFVGRDFAIENSSLRTRVEPGHTRVDIHLSMVGVSTEKVAQGYEVDLELFVVLLGPDGQAMPLPPEAETSRRTATLPKRSDRAQVAPFLTLPHALPRGDYVAQVRVVDHKGGKEVEVKFPFTLVAPSPPGGASVAEPRP